MTDRILAALADRPEGLTEAGLLLALPEKTRTRALRARLTEMYTQDEVWRLPVRTLAGQLLPLYFIPDPAELKRHRRRERRRTA